MIRNTCMQSIHCDQNFFTPTFITKFEWIMSSCSGFFAFFLFYLLFRLLFALTYTMFLLYALYNVLKGCYYIDITKMYLKKKSSWIFLLHMYSRYLGKQDFTPERSLNQANLAWDKMWCHNINAAVKETRKSSEIRSLFCIRYMNNFFCTFIFLSTLDDYLSLSLSIKYIYIYINYRTKLSILENRLLRKLSQIFNNFEYETNFNFYCARYCTFKKTQCIHTFNDLFSISFINWTQNTDKIFRVFKETYSVFFTIFSLYGREACHCAFMTL